ncbi:MAG: hypothetical protein JRF54_13095 [Deltaproteobacteria bacterium]|nr:hypothetical protein [Deltaproteobacteria bacterium]
MSRTAAALIIGNEILSGKIADTNTTLLARALFDLAIELRRVLVCPDEISTISKDLSDLRASHDLVFTSGGVGPTHDDVTIDGVAASFGRPVVRSVAVEKMIRQYHGDRTTEAHLRMANMPQGALARRTRDLRAQARRSSQAPRRRLRVPLSGGLHAVRRRRDSKPPRTHCRSVPRRHGRQLRQVASRRLPNQANLRRYRPRCDSQSRRHAGPRARREIVRPSRIVRKP